MSDRLRDIGRVALSAALIAGATAIDRGVSFGANTGPNRSAASVSSVPYGDLPTTVIYHPELAQSFNADGQVDLAIKRGDILILQGQEIGLQERTYSLNSDPKRTQILALRANSNVQGLTLKTRQNVPVWKGVESSTQFENAEKFRDDAHKAGLTQIQSSRAFAPGSCTPTGCEEVVLQEGAISQSADGQITIAHENPFPVRRGQLTRIQIPAVARDKDPRMPVPNKVLSGYVADRDGRFRSMGAGEYWFLPQGTLIAGPVEVEQYPNYTQTDQPEKTGEVTVLRVDSRVHFPFGGSVEYFGDKPDQLPPAEQKVVTEMREHGCVNHAGCPIVLQWEQTQSGLVRKS